MSIMFLLALDFAQAMGRLNPVADTGLALGIGMARSHRGCGGFGDLRNELFLDVYSWG